MFSLLPLSALLNFSIIKFWHGNKLNTLQPLLPYQILVGLEASFLKTLPKLEKVIKANSQYYQNLVISKYFVMVDLGNKVNNPIE